MAKAKRKVRMQGRPIEHTNQSLRQGGTEGTI